MWKGSIIDSYLVSAVHASEKKATYKHTEEHRYYRMTESDNNIKNPAVHLKQYFKSFVTF